MAETKEKRYVSDNAQLMAEWNWDKNSELGLDPKKITCGSGKKASWKCDKRHEWTAVIASRARGNGCPYCSNQRVLIGYNDLKTLNPSLASEWNYEKNGNLIPESFSIGSEKRVWWKCTKGHEWQATINHRSVGTGCPYCVGKRILKGYNDLRTINTELAKEWCYGKNGELTPEHITASSGKKVWWKCYKGHAWQATVADRSRGFGCPICNSERHTSFPEYAILFYLKKYGLQAIHTYKENGYELDIYIPSKRIAIEYDGAFWHKNKPQKDLEKNRKCQEDGITLYRLREELPTLDDSSIDYIVGTKQKNLGNVLTVILSEIIGIPIDVDLKKDCIEIENMREHTEKANSFAAKYPQLAKEWHYEKNDCLNPEHFSARSEKKVWWKCAKGHEWVTSISNRTQGNGCPICSNQKVLKGFNDLKTVNPLLADEWNSLKNGSLTPENVTSGSRKKVWWKCTKGHEWQATISHRSAGRGCPICSNKQLLLGYNDLLTVNPDLALEWNRSKNGDLVPEEVTAGSHTIVWWSCKEGHEWQATIKDRNAGRGCPYCSGRYATKGKNDLQTINPTLAGEWNYEKNDILTPEDVLPHSNKKVWWKCDRGHEWLASISSRTRGNGCPECAKSRRKNISILQ